MNTQTTLPPTLETCSVVGIGLRALDGVAGFGDIFESIAFTCLLFYMRSFI
jgi:hypothetical protein